MKQIDSIEIVLENCEVLKIPIDYISFFSFRGIKEDLFYNKANGIIKESHCEEFIISLKEEALNIKSNISKEFLPIRLKQKDIAVIYVYYSDETNLKIVVPWKGEETNELQTNIFNDDLTIEISIKEN